MVKIFYLLQRRIVDKNSIDKNIEIAQALNQQELNNLPASSDLQSIPPEENILENAGAPVEETQTEIEQESQEILVNTINAEDLEGVSDEGGPEEGLSLDPSETIVEIDGIPPSEDQNIEGAPSLGLEDSITELVENDEIVALPPETSNIIGEPLSDELQNLPEENETFDLQQVTAGPEEAIAEAGPADNSPQNIEPQELILATEGPSETLNEGAPEQTETQISQNVESQESLIDNIAQVIPEETQIEGNPQEVIGDEQLTEIAEVSEGPTEEVSLGNPEEETIQVEENLQIAEVTESAQLNPSIAISDGKPEEGIAFQSVAEDEEDIIAPQRVFLQEVQNYKIR